MGHDKPGFGVYVHWPFCQSKCPYCDFNSHAFETVDQSAWRTALLHELDWAVRDLQTEGASLPVVTSIFFGGGTPSLMPPETTAAIIARIKEHFDIVDDLEISLEANPSSTEAARFQNYKQAGINRLSLGIQALDDDALKFLGRIHSHEQALGAIETAAKTFDRFSFDLIYARPGQTCEQWQIELKRALALAGEHLSLYQLTIEPGTAFARQDVPASDEETGEALYLLTQDMMEAVGRPAYEISNHARLGAECRHNLTYWRGGGYLGVGPGAHGRLKRAHGWQAHHRIHNPTRWLEAVQSKSHGTAKLTDISPQDRRDEAILMGLRLREGLSRTNFEAATGLDLSTAFAPHNLERLHDGGFLILNQYGIHVTEEGWLRLDAVIAQLLND